MKADIPLKKAAKTRQVAAAGELADQGTPLTRSKVAEELGTSIASVRRLEGKTLHPRKGADGVHLFDPGEVAALAAHRTTASDVRLRRSAEGDLAAEAFKQFNRGLDIRAVVIELRQPPALIQDLHRQWREAGGLWIPSTVLAGITKAIRARYPGTDTLRIRAASDLADAVDYVLNDLEDARQRHWDGVDQIVQLKREKHALRERLQECRAELADLAEWAEEKEGPGTEPDGVT